jgi:1-acyl-sn-glycerol-3-phosphate acyltransferase
MLRAQFRGTATHSETGMGVLRATMILFLFLLLTIPIMPIQALLIASRLPLNRYVPFWYHNAVCKLLGI